MRLKSLCGSFFYLSLCGLSKLGMLINTYSNFCAKFNLKPIFFWIMDDGLFSVNVLLKIRYFSYNSNGYIIRKGQEF